MGIAVRLLGPRVKSSVHREMRSKRIGRTTVSAIWSMTCLMNGLKSNAYGRPFIVSALRQKT